MCVNQQVSLNTFVFSSFVLLLIVYNNFYTKYKIELFRNPWMVIFAFSIILIQLWEFFIWRNINNPFYNNLFSILATLTLVTQPIISIMILSNKYIRNVLLIIYSLFAIPLLLFRLYTVNIYSDISKNGHLKWHYLRGNFFIQIIWTFFLLFSFIYECNYYTATFALLTLAVTYYNYIKDNSVPSMWCWIVNSITIYFAGYLLVYLPFIEK